jgi:hypothetical protein
MFCRQCCCEPCCDVCCGSPCGTCGNAGAGCGGCH